MTSPPAEEEEGTDLRATARRTADRLDAFQKKHAQLSFPIAVFRKYSDDQAGNLGALLAYWAFFSMFPMLLVALTVAGFVGIGDGTFKAVLTEFPIVGSTLSKGSLNGSGVGLTIGVVTALWSGLGVFRTVQTAFDTVWNVPREQRPNVVQTAVRSLKAFVVLGTGFVITLGLSGIATGGAAIHVHLSILLRLVVGLVTIALDVVGFTVAYRWLTQRELGFGDVLPGAAVAGVGFFFLQLFGSALILHEGHGHTGAYATFGVVLGLLWWFALQAQVILLGAEINVVRVEQLWPRELV